jgi:hypothetical protein
LLTFTLRNHGADISTINSRQGRLVEETVRVAVKQQPPIPDRICTRPNTDNPSFAFAARALRASILPSCPPDPLAEGS